MKILFIITGISVAICIIEFIIAIVKRDTMEKTITKYGTSLAKAQNNIINNNEEILKETATKNANIHKDAIKTVAHSIKEGLADDNSIFCKYCGELIDSDSKFCKKCGKEL